jgi:FkbM family methyltransferase
MLATIRRLLGEWMIPPAYHRILDKRSQTRRERSPKWVVIRGGPLKGRQMLLKTHSIEFWQKEMAEGSYDSFIYNELCKLCNMQGQVVWDVGAHIGYHTLAMACLVGPSGHVIAFEPNISNLERLRANLDGNPDLTQRVIIKDFALSQNDEEMHFMQSSDVDGGKSSGSHLTDALPPLVKSVYKAFTETSVRCVKADTLFKNKSAPVPNVMKIDVEGAEHLVLNGAKKMLSGCRPFLFIEIHNVKAMLYVLELLFSLGYSAEILDAEHTSPSRCFILAKPVNEH